jgi:hypothetical protein
MRWHVKIRNVTEAEQLYEFVKSRTQLNLKGTLLYLVVSNGMYEPFEIRPCTLSEKDGVIHYHGFLHLLTDVYSVSVETFINNYGKRVTL